MPLAASWRALSPDSATMRRSQPCPPLGGRSAVPKKSLSSRVLPWLGSPLSRPHLHARLPCHHLCRSLAIPAGFGGRTGRHRT
eukprot:9501098-Pyramimonas_sp.AAC.1